jgi:hypothetical protein
MLDFEYRTVCVCGCRYPTKTEEGEAVCCPKCRTISPAIPEPVDEHWWAWLSVQPHYRQMMHWQPMYTAGGAARPTLRQAGSPAGSVPPAKPVKEPRKIEGVPL